MIVGLAIHIVSAILWIGGLSMALVILKPGVLAVDGQMRLAIWHREFTFVLPWSWVCIAALVLSGFAMVFIGFGELTQPPVHIRWMMGLGLLAVGIYAYFQYRLWRHFRRLMLGSDWTAAERVITKIRWLLGSVMLLGLAAAIAGSAGRYYF
jgi:uncharacterized membrane protein